MQATATHTQIKGLILRPRKIPKTGTSTIYIAVRKPAFPTVVCAIPICWMMEAHPSASPHRIPPRTSVFPLITRPSTVRRLPSLPGRIIRFCIRITGRSVIAPSRKRIATRVNGPMYSIPTLCATNAAPQIRAVRRRIADCLSWNRFFLDISSPSRHIAKAPVRLRPGLSGRSSV